MTILCSDISKGKEANQIQCLNVVDDQCSPQDDFCYVTQNFFSNPQHSKISLNSLKYFCECVDGCLSGCKCLNISLRSWYCENGKLTPDFNFADPPSIYECNLACWCRRQQAGSCKNCLVQKGISSRLLLFRIEKKGWGVQTTCSIAKGSFVCEYIGEIITSSEADQRDDDTYIFDLDSKDEEAYCIDAKYFGNVARFINHACDPNLVPVKVYIDYYNLKLPHIAFFACRDIDANEELTFDYGETFWRFKSYITCSCLSPKCKFLATLQTVEENKRSLKIQDQESDENNCDQFSRQS